MVDAALTGVDAGIASRPEILGGSVPVIPPGIGNSIELERRVIAIILAKIK